MTTPSTPTVRPGRVPPGAIGHNRGVVHNRYAFIPPEGVLKSRLPGYSDTVVRFLAAPSLGAEFVQMVLEIEPGGGTEAPMGGDVQYFFYVLSGAAVMGLAGEQPTTLGIGGFAYLPQGDTFTLNNQSASPTRVLVVRKRYEVADGIDAPPPFTGQRDDALATNHTGLEGRGFQHLLGFGDLRHDFEMNVMHFEPGTCFPAVETHIMEHGLYMLEGQGLYVLGQDWHEIWVDDFIWMGSFCPQQFYPTGQERAVYLLYKNVNRDVVL
jgi:(S)-ureidoglycine aminohydrolase